VAAHLEHGIRGETSEKDAEFVNELSEKLGVRCVVGSADVPGVRARGESVESAARRVRYEFLERCAREEGCQWVATGHTADDNAETVMMNLLRGRVRRGFRESRLSGRCRLGRASGW